MLPMPASAKKWATVKILKSLKDDIERLCNEQRGFSNTSQFVGFAVRKELDTRLDGKKAKKK